MKFIIETASSGGNYLYLEDKPCEQAKLKKVLFIDRIKDISENSQEWKIKEVEKWKSQGEYIKKNDFLIRKIIVDYWVVDIKISEILKLSEYKLVLENQEEYRFQLPKILIYDTYIE